jgi:L-ascorbate metabolism protein UlaG (beta-lactamase superfamily)
MKITLIGQSTLLIEMNDTVIMTDPWWGQFEFIRGVPLGLDPESLARVDIMAVSHNHIDHWSRPAIELGRRLNTTIVGSLKAAARARKAGLGDVHALKPGQQLSLDRLTVHAVPASHPFARDAVGFIFEGERTVYFSGDTRYTPELKKSLLAHGPDTVIVQVACSRYPLIGKDGMEMEDAALLVSDVKPETTVPMHYQVKGKVVAIETLRRWKVDSKLVVLEPGVPREL